MKRLNAAFGVPRVSCIVSDGVMSFAIEGGKELGIPQVQFWTASACGFMGYLQFPQLVNRGIIPFKGDLKTSLSFFGFFKTL